MFARPGGVPAALAQIAAVILLVFVLHGCGRRTPKEREPQPDHLVTLAKYGLPKNYAQFDDAECSAHVIGYRFLVWLNPDRIIVGFNTSPSCRSTKGQEVPSGTLRLLALDAHGNLRAQRDLAYAPDGGAEIVAPGEATNGPAGSLLIRIEEAHGAKSGVRLLDRDLKDVGQIDRFMETVSPVDHSLVFQEGFVSSGPRSYDVYDGFPLRVVTRVTQDAPSGTMDRRVGANGVVYAQCQQELRPGQYGSTNVIYSGTHRRCVLHVEARDGSSWSVPLQQDQVVEILGVLPEGLVVGIVRRTKDPDRLMVWSKDAPALDLPWFARGYDSHLESVAGHMTRYMGLGTSEPTCAIAGFFCDEHRDARLMIFDRDVGVPLLDRALSAPARVALAPDGLHYATFEAGEVHLYALPQRGTH